MRLKVVCHLFVLMTGQCMATRNRAVGWILDTIGIHDEWMVQGQITLCWLADCGLGTFCCNWRNSILCWSVTWLYVWIEGLLRLHVCVRVSDVAAKSLWLFFCTGLLIFSLHSRMEWLWIFFLPWRDPHSFTPSRSVLDFFPWAQLHSRKILRFVQKITLKKSLFLNLSSLFELCLVGKLIKKTFTAELNN